jgi:predicted alpha/beta superfamily hydrolase
MPSSVIGESFVIDSQALQEKRHINVYLARAWDTPPDAALPVLYMPDGGLAEDCLHVAGLLQVSVANGTMGPFMLVGMQNTQRRRDLTGPTDSADDHKIAPVVGGAQAYRAFIRDELMPEVKRRYRTTGETAIVGESLAGLFVVETYLLEPQLFNHYLAFDPSLWWNGGALPRQAAALLAKGAPGKRSLYLASSSEAGIAIEVQRRCRKRPMARSTIRRLCGLFAPCSSRQRQQGNKHGQTVILRRAQARDLASKIGGPAFPA